ncbi:hypothetical protein [Methylophaga sp.]|uniref:hypothetical protein n=1 Tax=Methylophaga sp. TaxID=2024840 RepID=UPI003A93AFA8
MTYTEIETWLTTSVVGIVLLGACGSILAVVLGKAFIFALTKVFPLPFLAHRLNSERRAFTLGYAAAVFEHSSKPHMSVIFMAYRLSRFVLALFMFITFIVLFSLVLTQRDSIVITYGLFALITLSFVSLYWARSEYLFIYYTYRSFWGRVEEKAHENVPKRETSEQENGT